MKAVSTKVCTVGGKDRERETVDDHGKSYSEVTEDRIKAFVASINSHAKSDETIEDIVFMGEDLIKLDNLCNLGKTRFPELGLKISYGWKRRLIRIAMDEKTSDRDLWQYFPAGRNQLSIMTRLKKETVLRSIKPDPEQRGEIFIHPTSSVPDLKKLLEIAKGFKPPKTRQLVCVIVFKRDEKRTPEQQKEDYMPRDGDGLINIIRDAAFEQGLKLAVAEVKSKQVKESMWKNDSRKETLWTLDMGPIENPPKDED